MCGEEILAVAKKCKHCGEYLKRPKTGHPGMLLCCRAAAIVELLAWLYGGLLIFGSVIYAVWSKFDSLDLPWLIFRFAFAVMLAIGMEVLRRLFKKRAKLNLPKPVRDI